MLKYSFKIFFFFLFLSSGSFAQLNLVPNPSFETYTACPTSFTGGSNDFTGLSGWWISSPSPDYYNSCAPNVSCVSVPNNAFGFQMPFNGNAYVGIIAFQANGTPQNLREYFSTQLTIPLSIGTTYYFSMQVSRGQDTNFHTNPCASGGNCGNDKLGMLLTTNKYDLSSNLSYRNFAHVYAHSVIMDTLNWVQVKGSIVADSAYKFINIGNFFDDFNTDTTYSFHSPLAPSACTAYYFIDEIIFSSDSSLLNVGSIKDEMTCQIFPNPVEDNFFFITNNSEITEISIYDCLGQPVAHEKYFLQNNISKIVLTNNIFSGPFLVELINKQKIIHRVLIKKQ